MSELSVVCVKWGDKYGPGYVTKLRDAVTRNLEESHRFLCVTDSPVEGVECWPLTCGLPTWWQKLGLLQAGMFAGDVFYLDLDVVATAALDPFVACLRSDPTRLWTLDDFSYSLLRPKPDVDPETARLLGGTGTVNSSVMLWRGDVPRAAWDRFTPAVMSVLHGDQNWITRCLWPDSIRLLPPALAGSYKYGQLRGEPVRPVMVFHGDPKPSQVRDSWVKTHWR